uniref:Pentatricopeptide repeat-containing protein n=1 Tax=Zea mays TaxID=4577 RepID=A0A804R257_MAIZE
MGWGSAARLDNPNRPNPMSLSRSQRRPRVPNPEALSLCSRSGGGAAVFSLPSLPSGLRPSLLVGRARRRRPARQSISCSPASPCSPVALLFSAFVEACKLVVEEKSPAEAAAMRPDRAACNSVLSGCYRGLGSLADAERVLETMSAVGVSPDVESFGCLAFLYAWRGVPSRVDELDTLFDALGFSKKGFFKNLVSGYLKSGDFESVSPIILRAVK